MTEPTQHPNDAIRASNADREAVVKRLADAYAEGRLELSEMDERTAAAYAAKTMGDLTPLTADLPAASSTAVVATEESESDSSGWSDWQPWLKFALPAVIILNLAVWAAVSALSDHHLVFPWWIILVVVWVTAGRKSKCGGWSGGRSWSSRDSRSDDSWYHQYTRESRRQFGHDDHG
jgi:hypothetical protein